MGDILVLFLFMSLKWMYASIDNDFLNKFESKANIPKGKWPVFSLSRDWNIESARIHHTPGKALHPERVEPALQKRQQYPSLDLYVQMFQPNQTLIIKHKQNWREMLYSQKKIISVQYAEPFLRLSGRSSVRRDNAVPHWLPAGTPSAATKKSKEGMADNGRAGSNIFSTVLAERIGFGGVLPTSENKIKSWIKQKKNVRWRYFLTLDLKKMT